MFDNGAFVCWGTTQAEERIWGTELSRFSVGPKKFSDHIYSEAMSVYTGSVSGVVEDCIVLGIGVDEREMASHQLAFSYALVRSLKLDILEDAMDRAQERIRDIPDNLIDGNFPSLHECRSIVGEQLKLRGMLNLYSELVETPDVYWEEPELERLFAAMEKELDIVRRVTILNKRLEHAAEITGVVRSYINERSTKILEIMIVLLIAVEVLFYVLDKSEYWSSWTWEGLLGLAGPTDEHYHGHGHHHKFQRLQGPNSEQAHEAKSTGTGSASAHM